MRALLNYPGSKWGMAKEIVSLMPKRGDVWKNSTPDLSYCARMTNTKSGWTMIAHGLVQYDDGTIEWDYSTDGYFGR